MLRSLVILVSMFAVLATFESASGMEAISGVPITLKQAIDIALLNNPRLKSAGFQVEAAGAGAVKARSGYFPKIEISETYQRTTNPMWAFGHKLNQESVTSVDFAPEKLNNPDPIDNWGTIITLSQTVYSGGKIKAYKDQAALAREASIKDKERVTQEVIFDVTKAYYAITLAESNLHVVRDALKSADAKMNMAQNQRDAGTLLESDFLSARLIKAGIKEEEIKALNTVQLGRATLNNFMGVDLQSDYLPSERLPDISDDLENQKEWSRFNGEENEAGLAAARPDLAGMKLREEIGEKEINAVRADLLPTIGLTANYEIDGSGLADGEGTNWTVMGVVKWNLFSGYEDMARTSEARAESNRIKEMRREMESGIRLEALSARLGLKASRERVRVASESVRQAEESSRIVNNRYAEGMATVVNLLGVETALNRAKTALTQAVYDYKVGEARVKLALGILE